MLKSAQLSTNASVSTYADAQNSHEGPVCPLPDLTERCSSDEILLTQISSNYQTIISEMAAPVTVIRSCQHTSCPKVSAG